MHDAGSAAAAGPWRIWIDTGGTFTDCLALDPGGGLHRAKVLSSSALRGTIEQRLDALRLRVREEWSAAPDMVRGFGFRLLGVDHPPVSVEGYDPAEGLLRLAAPLPTAEPGAAFEVISPEEAPILAARLVTRTPLGSSLPPIAMRLATTRGTNALLERKGVPAALFITDGFADLLRIGTQQRPDLFALEIRRPEPLYHTVVEVPGRLAADGAVLAPLELERIAPAVEALRGQGIRTAAVALLHAFRNPRHEQELETFLRANGFEHVSRSSELAPFIKLLPRAETATLDAYLAPILGEYLAGVRGALDRQGPSPPNPLSQNWERGNTSGVLPSPLALHASVHRTTAGEGGRLLVMTSAGGLVRPENFRAKDGLLSGPAGGVVGAVLAGRRSGMERIIAFDMGGTSTDVARWDGDFEYVWEHRVGAGHILAPALAIESVAAGGGSVCALDANGLKVGPESAGASPGPACYGAGGPLAVTDVNLLLGRLDPARFGIPIDAAPAEAALDTIRGALRAQRGEETAREPLLEGFLAIANERMADAIRGISLRKGYDPADYTLVAFGGAGAQHACGVAERLGIRKVLVPPDAGLLSALGIGHAVVERFAERQVLQDLETAAPRVAGWVSELAAEAAEAVAAEGVAEEEVLVRRQIANLRYSGQESTLSLECAPDLPLRDAFEQRYQEVYGHRPEQRPIELESLRVIASSRPGELSPALQPPAYPAVPHGTARAWMGGAWTEVPIFERAHLHPGARVPGPALVWEHHSATVVEAGWEGEVDGAGGLMLTRKAGSGKAEEGSSEGRAGVEAVQEELFTQRFRALVEEMGEQLRRTALSTNVKERLDFSCALLDAGGELVVNAPHIPVHLGALGLCVRRVREALAIEPGDVVVTNHPAFGGSHLPDVTVITPVHGAGGELLGYVASRAHHAELGGSRPGSMPPAARTLAEEGVVIAPRYLVRQGEARWDELHHLLREGPYPSRSIEDNLADLRAQVAANQRGAELLRALAATHGAEKLAHYMAALTSRAERRVREALARLADGIYRAEEWLDDGSPLRVRIEITGDRAVIDFAGSAAIHPGNLNATPAIVRSVVLYVLRLLVDEPLPLNEGLMRAVELHIPEGMLNPSFPDDAASAPAVVGGNVETSQRLTDTLLKALRLAACSQGTMNNVLWGTADFGYYETVCGGAGAGPGFQGADAVHTHMTNTRITDPEVVEVRYPVRVERFAIRRGSGGAGRWRGGDGALRELLFLEAMTLSILSQHRVERPYGLEGGEPGQPGRQRVIRVSGEEIELGASDGCEVGPGDRLVLETPGGGGWGES